MRPQASASPLSTSNAACCFTVLAASVPEVVLLAPDPDCSCGGTAAAAALPPPLLPSGHSLNPGLNSLLQYTWIFAIAVIVGFAESYGVAYDCQQSR